MKASVLTTLAFNNETVSDVIEEPAMAGRTDILLVAPRDVPFQVAVGHEPAASSLAWLYRRRLAELLLAPRERVLAFMKGTIS